MPTYEALVEVTRADTRAPFVPALVWLYDREAGAITLLTLASAPDQNYADKYLAGLEPSEAHPTPADVWAYWCNHGGGNSPFRFRTWLAAFEAPDIVVAMIRAVELALAYDVELAVPLPPLPTLAP